MARLVWNLSKGDLTDLSKPLSLTPEKKPKNIPNCKELSEGDFLSEIFTHEDDENPDSPNYTSAIIAMNERGTILGIIGYLN